MAGIDNYIETVMNPIRLQIIEYLTFHEKSSAAEISEFMKEVPAATLYRHINKLVKSGLVRVVDERKKRGAVERILSLDVSVLSGENTEKNARKNTFAFLFNLQMRFSRYYRNESNNAFEDMLFLKQSAVNCTDSEFADLLKEIGDVMDKYMALPQEGERKVRNISIISSPNT